MSNPASDFSTNEMSYINDREFLLTKIEINRKIEVLLGLVEQRLHKDIASYDFHTDVLTKSGKISKGDNYQNLPYYMLDFPRKFGKEGIFAFRTMFWWGNFFSTTLHMAGKYLDAHRQALKANIQPIKLSNPYICVNDNPWEYHYGIDNYLQASELSEEELQAMFSLKTFVKISCKWELEQYPQLPDLVQASFHQALKWI